MAASVVEPEVVRDGTKHVAEKEKSCQVAQLLPPVAQPKLRLVQPVAQKVQSTRRATGGTRRRTPKESNGLEPLHIEGHEWRFTGYGWELWRRVPSRSENGKRSSKRKYLAYYSKEAVEKLYEREKTFNTRRVERHAG